MADDSAFKNEQLLKGAAQTWGTRVYFKEHTMIFPEEDLLLFPSIFYLPTCVCVCVCRRRVAVKGESGWREKDSRERSIQEVRQLKFPEPERNIAGKGGGWTAGVFH